MTLPFDPLLGCRNESDLLDKLALDGMQQRAWQTSEDHGWHEPRDFEGVVREMSSPERIALIHSEASEALEEIREGAYDLYFKDEKPDKPEGAIIELADVVIRVLDMAEDLLRKGLVDTTLAKALAIKMDYNDGREYLHGGKRL